MAKRRDWIKTYFMSSTPLEDDGTGDFDATGGWGQDLSFSSESLLVDISLHSDTAPRTFWDFSNTEAWRAQPIFVIGGLIQEGRR